MIVSRYAPYFEAVFVTRATAPSTMSKKAEIKNKTPAAKKSWRIKNQTAKITGTRDKTVHWFAVKGIFEKRSPILMLTCLNFSRCAYKVMCYFLFELHLMISFVECPIIVLFLRG